jgi:hypothetical protein
VGRAQPDRRRGERARLFTSFYCRFDEMDWVGLGWVEMTDCVIVRGNSKSALSLFSITIRKVKSGLDCFSVQMMSKCVAPDFVPEIESKGFITLLSDMGEELVWVVHMRD